MLRITVLFFLFVPLLGPSFVECKRKVPIGGVFVEKDAPVELAFRYAVDRANMYNRNIELVPQPSYVGAGDSFKMLKTVCNMMEGGIAAVFGPMSNDTAGIVGSVCENVEMPNLQVHWSARPQNRNMVLNLYPDAGALANALADLVVDYDWKSFTVIYERDEGLVRLKEMLKIHGPQDPPITVRQLSPGSDYRPLFKEIRDTLETRIILDCSPDKIVEILRQANDVKMLEAYQSYIITSLDTHTIDFEELKFGRANITAMRLLDPKSFEIRNAVQDWQEGERRYGRKLDINEDTVTAEAALMHDAVNLFTTAFSELNEQNPIDTETLDCSEKQKKWEHGLGLLEYMKLKTINGLTGPIEFDEQGRRTNFNLEVIELSEQGFKKIATWDPVNRINNTRSMGEVYSKIVQSLQNRTMIVSSRIGAPFLLKRIPKDGEVLEGNARYEGYSMDLIDGIAKQLGFKYIFELTPDGAYGSYDREKKTWNGLVKQLLDRKADLAICDLTITYERRSAVDFTMPFMTLGISILYAKPIKQPPDLFSFLSPLSLEVWMLMAIAYIGVSVLLFVLARMAPEDWENPHPCNQEPEELENIWHMLNCVWLTMGSIMGQGCDILPKAISTRMVTGAWWFFALIMLASYTANLAAFLTMDRMEVSIESAEDLAKQTKIKYGAVLGGSTLSFFKESNFSTYQRMWANMESARPSVFTSSNDEGVERVLKGKRLYAFLMESTSLQYMVERNCELTQIGRRLDSKGYGIAMPVNSPYRTAISGAVLKMQEEGKLHQLKTKWWKEMHGGGKCTADAKVSDDSAAELGIDNVGGVFVVLGCGCGVAVVIAIMEFLWNVRKVAVDEKITPWEAFWAELKFALNVWIVTKPVHNKPSESTESNKSSKSRGGSECRSSAANVLNAATSFMNLDRAQSIFH